MLVKTNTAALVSVEAHLVTVEVNVEEGSSVSIVGLPDASVKESYYRIETASENSGFTLHGNRVIVNLSPGDLKKEGTAYDLPIAVGVIAASGFFESGELQEYLLAGELSLDGEIRPIKGALPMAILAAQKQLKGIIVPRQNAREAAVVKGIKVLAADKLADVVAFFSSQTLLDEICVDLAKEFEALRIHIPYDFSEVRGQENVKRAMEVAAAGGHNILMVGAPGSGKSMIAKRVAGILPPFTLEESLETTKIYSVAGKLPPHTMLMTARPFRSPHNSVSIPALVGGGTSPRPGEISLAHNGVLFLDELAEFNRSVLELLRQPLEDRCITVSRAKATVDYPASFMLVAAMNPCPCGYYNHPTRACSCAPGAVQKYLARISGPLLDRIDIQVEITPVAFEEISDTRPTESSASIRERVIGARSIQAERFKAYSHIHCNAQMTPALTARYCALDDTCLQLLKTAMERFGLSARAYDRILKVSRTIADLDSSETIRPEHLREAILYRNLDRSTWGSL